MMHASFEEHHGVPGKRRTRLVLTTCFAAALALGGCTMSETQQRTASGAGIGAAAGAAGGALIGALTGNAGTGAAIGALSGAAVGGAGGYVHDQQVKRGEAETETEQLRRENDQLRAQQEADQLRLENERLQQQLNQQQPAN